MSDEPQTCRCGAGLPMLQCGDCFRQYFAADEYGPVSQAIATAEARGAALAIEQCRRLAEEAVADAPNGWMREALERFVASLPAAPDLKGEP